MADTSIEYVMKLQDQMSETLKKIEANTGKMNHAIEHSENVIGKLKTAFIELQVVEKVIDLTKDAFKAFTDFNMATAQVQASITSTGGAAGVTAEEIDKLSESLSKNSLYTKTTVKSMESVLLTFTALKKDILPQASQAIADMASKMHSDLQETAVQVGKALQDPIHGIAALHRVGVNFSEAQKVVIERLVKTGQVAKAQQLILGELKTEFGGSAAAAAKANPFQVMKNQAEEFMVKIGGGVSKMLTMITPVIQKVMEFVEKLFQTLESSGIGDIFKELASIAGEVVDALMPIIEEILPPILALMKPIVQMFHNVWDLVKEIIKPLQGELAPILEYVGELVTMIADVFQHLMPILKPIFSIIGSIASIIIKIALWIDKTIIKFVKWLSHTKVFKAVWDTIAKVIEKVVGFIGKIVGGIKKLLGMSKQAGGETSAKEEVEAATGAETAVGSDKKELSNTPQQAMTSQPKEAKMTNLYITMGSLVNEFKIVTQTLGMSERAAEEFIVKTLLGATNGFNLIPGQ
jgi:phage-related protein